MKILLFLFALTFTLFGSDMIIKESACSVDETLSNIKKIVEKKGLGVFAVVDHGANAEKVGMKLQKSKMIIFGNPKLGTKLMQEDITAGLDLPLRILVYKESDGKVKMAYRNGSWLAQHHTITVQKRIAKVDNAMEKITTRAGQCRKD